MYAHHRQKTGRGHPRITQKQLRIIATISASVKEIEKTVTIHYMTAIRNRFVKKGTVSIF